mgnify:FL=1
MKFIHTGDIHYGMRPDVSKPWAKERYTAVKEVLGKIIDECKKRQVDCLFISGDLFHKQPLNKDLKEINYLFAAIPHTRVIIIAGNRDKITENSNIYDFPWAENVYYITSNEMQGIYFADINTEVFGFSYHSKELKDRLLDGIVAPSSNRIHILMAHGGDSLHLPFDKEDLVNSGFSYIALGHSHKSEVFDSNIMAYCGSPEPLDVNESGAHGIFYGEISEFTRKVSRLDFIPIADIEYIPLVINVNKTTSNLELITGISDEIVKRGTKHIYKLTILGVRDPYIDFDLDSLHEKFRIAKIIDDSEPMYDFAKLFSEHSNDMIGFFIKELNRENISKLDKKALNYGVSALLKTMYKGV